MKQNKKQSYTTLNISCNEVHKIKGLILYQLLKDEIMFSTFWEDEDTWSKFKTAIKYFIICFCQPKGNSTNLSEINLILVSSLLHDCS